MPLSRYKYSFLGCLTLASGGWQYSYNLIDRIFTFLRFKFLFSFLILFITRRLHHVNHNRYCRYHRKVRQTFGLKKPQVKMRMCLVRLMLLNISTGSHSGLDKYLPMQSILSDMTLEIGIIIPGSATIWWSRSWIYPHTIRLRLKQLSRIPGFIAWCLRIMLSKVYLHRQIPFCYKHLCVITWDFVQDGFISSDCDAVYNGFNPHGYTSTAELAASKSILAGTDINCGITY